MCLEGSCYLCLCCFYLGHVVAAWEQNGQFLKAATLRQQDGVGHHPCFGVTAFHISFWGWSPSIWSLLCMSRVQLPAMRMVAFKINQAC